MGLGDLARRFCHQLSLKNRRSTLDIQFLDLRPLKVEELNFGGYI
jgi:hypothetical protein